MHAAIRKACAECELTCIDKYETTKDVRRGIKDLKEYYYGVYSCKEEIGKIMQKIHHATYHKENDGKSCESYTGLLRDCSQQLKHIFTDTDIRDAQNFKLIIDGIKANNY